MCAADSIVPQKNPMLAEAIRDAQLVLAHAARAGTALDPDVIKHIVDVGALAATEQISSDQEAQFWGVWNRLSKAVAPLTIASLRAITQLQPSGRLFGPRTQARKAELRYRTYATVALMILLVAQAYWLFGNAVTVEIARTTREVTGVRAKLVAIPLVAPRQDAPVTSLPEPPEQILEEALYKTLLTRQDANRALLESWISPWSGLVPANSSGGTVTFAWQEAARFQTALTVLEIFQRYVLALLYGFLGACVHVLRGLSAEIRQWAYSRDSEIRIRIRLFLGNLGGIVIAWFVTPQKQSLAVPVAVAICARVRRRIRRRAAVCRDG